MALRPRTYRRLFVAGFALLLLSPVGIMFAQEYDFHHTETMSESQAQFRGYDNMSVSYDDLSDAKQERVDRALDGETVLVRTLSALPSEEGGTIVVVKDGTYQIFETAQVINWTDKYGIAAAVLVVLGLGLMAWTFPKVMKYN